MYICVCVCVCVCEQKQDNPAMPPKKNVPNRPAPPYGKNRVCGPRECEHVASAKKKK